jgi:hypothetical protein
MDVFHNNQIFDVFLQITLEAQKPFRQFSFDQRGPNEWTLRCSFMDGFEVSRDVTMVSEQFFKEWKAFVLWFENSKLATAKPIE